MTLRNLLASCAVAACGAGLIGSPAVAQGKWSGIYIGASAGWIGSEIDYTFPNGTKPSDISSDDLLLGGHIGIQHQFNQFVIGVEASFSDTVGDDDLSGGSCPNAAFNCLGRVNSLFQVGPRLGWTPSEQWMLYVTGGYANGRINTSNVGVATGIEFDSSSSRHDGWYIGGGFEFALTKNWILGLEYQHVELDARDVSPAPFNATEIRNGLDSEIDIVRARLTFKFGREERVDSLK